MRLWRDFEGKGDVEKSHWGRPKVLCDCAVLSEIWISVSLRHVVVFCAGLGLHGRAGNRLDLVGQVGPLFDGLERDLLFFFLGGKRLVNCQRGW